MLAHPTPHKSLPIRSPEQTLATSLPSPSLPSATQTRLRLLPVVPGMAGSGSEFFTSRSADPELIPRGPEEEMVVRLALRRSREKAHARQRSDSFYRGSIMSAHGPWIRR